MAYLKETIELDAQEAALAVADSLQQFPSWQRYVLIFCAVAIIPGFFITKAITVAVLTQSYKQYLVTAKPSHSNPKDLSLGDVVILPVQSGVYSAYVTLSNENLNLAANGASYEVKFFNDQKEQVYVKSGTLTLLPNQKTYIIVPRFTSIVPTTSGTVKITAVRWQQPISIPDVKLETPAPLIKNIANPPSFNLEGAVVNRSPYDLGKITLLFLLKDQSGKIVAVSSRDEFTVARGERRAYVQPWPGLSSSAISSVEVLAVTNPLDSKNLSSGGNGGAGNLDRPSIR